MPTAIPIAAALTTAAAHPWILTIGGLDVIKEPGGAGFGVSPATVRVVEAGPGGVSSIEFDVDDPFKSVAIADGAELVYWNATADVPIFRGYVDTWQASPAFGDQGRRFRVEGVGVETLLDWLINPGGVVGGPAAMNYAAGWLAGYLGFPGSVGSTEPTPSESSETAPVGSFIRTGTDATLLNWFSTVLPEGATLREAIAQALTHAIANDTQGPGSGFGGTAVSPMFLTVDFLLRLRQWQDQAGRRPTDYTDLTVSDAGPIRPENLTHRRDPGQIIRAVYVKGADAASSGWVVDGSGVPGRQAYLADTTIGSALERDQAARAVMASSAAGVVRGEFDLIDFTPVETVHTGSFVTITSSALGLSGEQFRIMEIEKRFTNAGRQSWHVSYGSFAPSITRLTRQFTRATLR
jgi:hypothetical protein